MEYGPEKLPAGPEVGKSEELIIVEGRADVINLLRHGYRNAVAVEGVKIPKTIKDLSAKKRRVVAFLDGDRGGDLILSELQRAGVKVDLVARAPYGREVEGLTGKEISDALHHAIPFDEAIRRLKIPKEAPQLPEKVKECAKEVEGKLMAIILNSEVQEVERVPVSELAQRLQELRDQAKYIVFDGVITQRLVDILSETGVDVYLVGVRVGEISKPSERVHIITFDSL